MSDTTDVPVVLLESIAVILERERPAEFSFNHEPKEIRWNIDWENGLLSIRIATFETWGDAHGGVLRWQGSEVDPIGFAQGVLDATENILDLLGNDGYRAGWSAYHPPGHAIDRLRAAIVTYKGRRQSCG